MAAEELEPPTNKAMPYAYLAGVYQSQGKWDEAVASYKKAIELAPKNVVFHDGLGYALQRQGKMAEAIACYRRATELDPKFVGPHNTLAWILATCADPKLRDPAEALRHAETAVELAPKYALGWQTLAWARYRTGDWKGAVAVMTKVRELGKERGLEGDSREWFLLALAHWKLGDKAEARAWYDRAVEWMEKNQPKDEELRRFRTEAAQLLGVTFEVAPLPHEKK